jgi:hypothetical protein
VRQRNDTGYPRNVSAWPTDDLPDIRPFEVAPAEVIDHPELLAGFTALDPPPEPKQNDEPAPAPEAESAAAATKTKKSTTAAQPATPGGDAA